MKKLLLLGFSILTLSVWGQNIDFGLKAGAVFNADKGAITTINDGVKNNGKGATGFQAGGLVRINIVGFYIQPELLYTQYQNEYEPPVGESVKLTKKRLDIPVNIGKTFGLGTFGVQLGPVFSYYFEDDFSVSGITDAKRDEFNVGFQLGANAKVKSILFDLRYEFGFGKTVTEWAGFKAESNPKLINLSVGYLF